MIIDSHCHLTYEPMYSSLSETIDRANKDGVKYMLTISTENKSYDKILSIVSKHKSVYGTYGIHPHQAKLHKNISNLDIIKKVNLNKKIIGIGETGLDFYYNHSDQNDQINCFEQHIYASQEKKLPLIVHTRSAEKETLSRDFAFKLLDLGSYISASGVITFKKSQDLANTFKDLPNDKILVETDAPYLAPVPLRGKPNEPSYIIHTIKFLSDMKKLSFDEFSNITSDNFFNLFGKLN